MIIKNSMMEISKRIVSENLMNLDLTSKSNLSLKNKRIRRSQEIRDTNQST